MAVTVTQNYRSHATSHLQNASVFKTVNENVEVRFTLASAHHVFCTMNT